METEITSSTNEIKKDVTGSGYSVTISPRIYNRLEKHIFLLKKLVDKSSTKQRWVTNAIKEKLKNDEVTPELPKTTSLSIKIDEELDNMILDKIEFIKKFGFSYSKKKWIVDAILEKLERDEKEIEGKIFEAKPSQIEALQQLITTLQKELALQKSFLQTIVHFT